MDPTSIIGPFGRVKNGQRANYMTDHPVKTVIQVQLLFGGNSNKQNAPDGTGDFRVEPVE